MSAPEQPARARPLTPEDVVDSLERVRDSYEAERRARFTAHGVPANCLWPASWVYHRDSGLGPHWRAGMSLEEVEEHTAEIVVRRFPDSPTHPLPLSTLGSMTLQEALGSRRSCRAFADRPVPLTDVATILHASCGVTHDATPGDGVAKRAAPSGGALYPVESFLLVEEVEGLPEGVYHYVPLRHELAWLRPLRHDDLAAFLPPGLLETPVGALVVLTVRFDRTAKKYVERGYRFALLETGHIAQNLCITAVARGLGATCVGGFWDDPLNSLLGLDSDEEAAVYVVMLGVPAQLAEPSDGA